MNPSLLPLLRCPAGCDASLQLRRDSGTAKSVDSGAIRCCACDRSYLIEEGIPRMLPDSLNGEAGAETSDAVVRQKSEMRARDAQAGDYDRMWYLNLFGLAEIPATLLHLSLGPEHTLLEAGCGTGRMTRQFARRAGRLISIDFSWQSLLACASKLRRSSMGSVDLIQADLCHLPFQSDTFDRVVSCQVLEHVPTATSREAAVHEIARVSRPDGNIAISAYQYSLMMRLFGQKEGEHEGGIPFYRFTRGELERLLSCALTVESMTGALLYHYIARCRKESPGCRS